MTKLKTKMHLAHSLIAAIEGGSIAEGARALNITRSAASKNIAALENALGVELLVRTPRSISLTEAGQKYVHGVSSALQKIENVESTISQFRNEPSGVLTIDSAVLFGRLYLTEIIQSYLIAFRGMTVDLRLNDDSSDVASGKIDLYFRTGQVKHQDMIAVKLMDISFRTIVSPSYVVEFGKPATIEALEDHNCLNFRFPSDHMIFQWRHKLENEIVYRRFGGNFISTDAEEIRKAVLRGVGIAQLPDRLVDADIQSGALVELFPHTVFTSKPLYMCFPRRRKNDLKLSSFRKHLKNHIRREDSC